MGLAYSESATQEGFAPQLVRIIYHNSSAAPGEGFKVDLHWQNIGDEPANCNYWIFIHFRPEGDLEEPYSNAGFSWDFPPAKDTSLWQTGFVVKEEGCYFRVPKDIPPGKYTVLIGLYDRENIESRVVLQNRTRDIGRNRYRVGQVNVVDQPGQPAKLVAYRLVWRVKEPKPLPEPSEPRYLVRGRLGVGFDPARPLILQWRYGGSVLALGGDAALQGPDAEFISLADGKVRTSLALDADWTFNCRISDKAALYKCRLKWKQSEVARFEFRFSIERTNVSIKLTSVQEAEGFQLLNVTLPALASVSEDQPGAALVHSSWGGRIVDISSSGRHRHIHEPGPEQPLPSACVCCDSAAAVLWVKSTDDQVVTEVTEAGNKHGTVGVRLAVRSRDGRLLSPNKSSSVELTILTPQRNEPISWIDCATTLQGYYRSRSSALFNTTYSYRLDISKAATLEEASAMLERFGRWTMRLLGNCAQLVFVTGWQPSFDAFDFARILKPLNDAEDQLPHFVPAWDWREHFGQNAQFDADKVSKAIQEIIKLSSAKAVFLHGIISRERRQYQTTVSPYGGDAELSERRLLLDSLRRIGVEIATDDFIAPLTGSIQHYWQSCCDQDWRAFSFEYPIPLVPAVMHGKVTYGWEIDPSYGKALTHLYGSSSAKQWDDTVTETDIYDSYFRAFLPWSLSSNALVEDFQIRGEWKEITYSNGMVTSANLSEHLVEMVLDGLPVYTKSYTCIPMGKNRMVVFSEDGGILRLPLPTAWNADAVCGELLLKDGSRQNHTVLVEGREVVVEIPPSTPVHINRLS